MVEEMPKRTAEELQAECIRLLKMDPSTRDIRYVGIIRLNPEGTGPNWTFGELDPMPTPHGLAIATRLIASVAGTLALAD